ncbi:hypothetical protein [Sphaerotilus mobilis]|uniref:Uncharacterized protein n=1 Tax=Sphaerotilus mobilis TaxID=47994 RepID=A0A4Q7LUB4_9BURK|nr:hypothetical protein [Sphaerotilus mobilis]RZS58765.1 hypothetical protein EV685_1065 [Sphaerotilus mobilis]
MTLDPRAPPTRAYAGGPTLPGEPVQIWIRSNHPSDRSGDVVVTVRPGESHAGLSYEQVAESLQAHGWVDLPREAPATPPAPALAAVRAAYVARFPGVKVPRPFAVTDEELAAALAAAIAAGTPVAEDHDWWAWVPTDPGRTAQA